MIQSTYAIYSLFVGDCNGVSQHYWHHISSKELKHACPFFVDINDCAAKPCQNGATCIDGINNYTCLCADGFTDYNCSTSEFFIN